MSSGHLLFLDKPIRTPINCMKIKTSIHASLPTVFVALSFPLRRLVSRTPLCLVASAAALLLFNAPIAHAQTFVPTSGTAAWNLDANWSPATIPNAVGASVVFDTPTAARTITVDSGATGFTIGSLTFNNNSAFANALQVGTAGSNLILDNGGAGVTLTFDGTGASLANQAVSTAMVFNDNVTGVVNYVANSTANIATQGAFNWTGSVSGGTGGFTKTAPGGMTFGTANKQYTGPTLFDTDSGRIRISINGRPSATSSVTVKSGAMLELISDGTYSFGSGPLNLNGIGNPANPGVIRPDRVANVGGRVLTISNPVVLQSDSLLHSQTIASGSNPNAITTGSITLPNIVSGPGNLAFTAPFHNQELGTLVLSGANTYEGGTLVRGGTVVVGGSASASLGTGDVTVESSHAVFAGASAKLTIQTGVLNAIADTATLSLAGGNVAGSADDGFAELQSGIDEFVGSLVLAGVAQGPGTYGSSSSPATVQDDEFFAGTGIVTVLPSLTITLAAPNVILSWPTSATGFTLQELAAFPSTLPPYTWTDVSTLVVISGANNTVTVPASSGNNFFRLKK